MQFVGALLRRLPEHEVPLLESVQAASKALQQGLALNAARSAVWTAWQESMETCKKRRECLGKVIDVGKGEGHSHLCRYSRIYIYILYGI